MPVLRSASHPVNLPSGATYLDRWTAHFTAARRKNAKFPPAKFGYARIELLLLPVWLPASAAEPAANGPGFMANRISLSSEQRSRLKLRLC